MQQSAQSKKVHRNSRLQLNDFVYDLGEEFADFSAIALERARHARSIGANSAAAKLTAISQQLARCSVLADAVYEQTYRGRGGRNKSLPMPTRAPLTAITEIIDYPEVEREIEDDIIDLYLIACQSVADEAKEDHPTNL